MNKVLITGSNGLVGRSLLKLLRNSGFFVIPTDYNTDDELFIEKMDVTVPEEISKGFSLMEPGDVVIHLAALVGGKPSEKNPYNFLKVNVMGTINILEEMRTRGLDKIIFMSSWATYGNDISLPINESTPQNPLNPYAVSKVMCEAVIRLYKNYGIKSVIFRPSFIYGPEQTEKIHIQQILDCLTSRETFEIWGEGTHLREYIYVDDMAKILRKAILYEPENDSEMFVAGTGMPISVNDIVKRVQEEIGPFSVKWVPNSKWVFNQESDPKKMIEKLDIYPSEFIDIIEGMGKCLEWRSLQPKFN